MQCINSLQYVRVCTSTSTNSCSGSVLQGYVLTDPQPAIYTSCLNIQSTPSELQPQLFNITAAEGLELSAAIVAVWAIGFAVRMGIRASNVDENQ